MKYEGTFFIPQISSILYFLEKEIYLNFEFLLPHFYKQSKILRKKVLLFLEKNKSIERTILDFNSDSCPWYAFSIFQNKNTESLKLEIKLKIKDNPRWVIQSLIDSIYSKHKDADGDLVYINKEKN